MRNITSPVNSTIHVYVLLINIRRIATSIV